MTTIDVNKELFSKMPKKIADFIQKKVKTDYLVEDKGIITTDLWLDKLYTSATFYIEENKKLVIRMDYVLSIQDLASEYLFNSTKISEKEAEKMKDELQLNHEKLLESMKEHGYRFGISHDMGDGLGQYWDMIIPVSKWKEESFVSLWRQLDAQVTLTTDKLEKAGFTF